MYAKKYNATSQTWQPTGKIFTTKSEDLTLPATINSNGAAITAYTIKGNTVQDGTPTPDNPIMPQGTGDLEAVGAKAGQYKIPISTANTTTPVYLGEVETTRRIKKLVLTGQEDWRSQYNGFTLSITKKSGWNTIICTHYPETGSIRVDKAIYNASTNVIIIFDSDYENVTDFKTYLQQQYAAGTPVTVWYVLATKGTGIVNEPLMKIGNYADSITSSQAGVSIPTVAGDNTLSADTTVQPSEFTATWTGWHELVGKVFDGTDWI